LARSYVQRVAHRGGSALAPENTLAAFQNALTLPIDAIELDVHRSRDGQAVVIHDNTLERLTNGIGNILDLDFAYLRGLNVAAHFAGGWPEPQRIPTLREVLELAKGRVQVYIEIKTSKRGTKYGRYPDIAEIAVGEVRSLNMLADVLIMSFDWTLLPLVKALEPLVQTGALVSNEQWNSAAPNAFDTLLEQVTALDCTWINMDRKLFTPTMPNLIHEHGLNLGLWTVNSLREMRQFASEGVDSITSDRPDLFAKLGGNPQGWSHEPKG
jgi:glycerophosphoryl diester phosphodiesterase